MVYRQWNGMETVVWNGDSWTGMETVEWNGDSRIVWRCCTWSHDCIRRHCHWLYLTIRSKSKGIRTVREGDIQMEQNGTQYSGTPLIRTPWDLRKCPD